MIKEEQWYASWFDSPYYHLLYNNRDEKEADFFIENLCAELNLPAGARVWDLACGKGRHSLALFRKGLHVTGTDLSENSIRLAGRIARKGLVFRVHDMRTSFEKEAFDAVFNLFTSLGYFDDFSDNSKVFQNVAAALKKPGYFVVDFFNADKVRASIKPSQTEVRGDITYDIKKEIRYGKVIKKISFSDLGRDFTFEEHVSLLEEQDFRKFAKRAGLKIHKMFGDYGLGPFDPAVSDRLIMIFRKQ